MKSGLPALCLSVLALSSVGVCAVITPVPRDFQLDGNISEWKGVPHVRAAPSVWYGQESRGIVIAGFLDHSRLSPDQRVDVWLSAAEPFDLPGLAYTKSDCTERAGGQAQAKADCLDWVNRTNAYLKRLKRLFVREWQVGPTAAKEAYAQNAYNEMDPLQVKALDLRRPAGVPIQRFQQDSEEGRVTFEILIPWEIFPPANRLSLESLRLTVGEFVRDRDKFAEQLPVVAMSPPITSRITACSQPLVAKDQRGEDIPAFYFLNSRLQIDETFILTNWMYPWNDPLPRKDYVSPVSMHQRFFAQQMGNGEFLCGPFMSYRRGSEIRRYPFRLDAPGDQSGEIKLPLPVMRLPDGTRLVRLGPVSGHGPLWKKSMTYFTTLVFALSPSLDVQQVLNLWGRDRDGAYEVEFSDDWSTVKEFQARYGEGWSSKTHCLKGSSYELCAEDPNSPPPSKRVLTAPQ